MPLHASHALHASGPCGQQTSSPSDPASLSTNVLNLCMRVVLCLPYACLSIGTSITGAVYGTRTAHKQSTGTAFVVHGTRTAHMHSKGTPFDYLLQSARS